MRLCLPRSLSAWHSHGRGASKQDSRSSPSGVWGGRTGEETPLGCLLKASLFLLLPAQAGSASLDLWLRKQ